MRHPILISLCLTGVIGLSACEKNDDETVERAIQDVNVVDETNLNDVMLTVADSMLVSSTSVMVSVESITVARSFSS